MFLGVPYLPFFMVAGGLLLLSVYTNFWFLLAIPVAIFIMRQMAKRDELIFRLLGLRLLFKFKARNLQDHDGMWVFSPNHYRKKAARTD
ncbi:type IV secretory pathway, VirB3-like protein [Stenotrophomonas indicatrix]|jgi:type IV secretion system protein VirB3|nr:type IV secretory pathway, VirB3-like protein [Stenotrophomonas indicatrix]